MNLGILMEETKKFSASDEQEADLIIEHFENVADGVLLDVKKSLKEVKNKGEYWIVTVKIRHVALDEVKETYFNG